MTIASGSLTDRLNTSLSGHYHIEREIGAGGMATVYLAHDLKHDRDVAIKVLRAELAESLGRERFLREIQLAAKLVHPHILPLFDSGDADGALYYVMPFVEGESLRDRLTREKQLPVDDALRIAREVADALSFAHAHDVVHRDIKPENILLEGGHAVVADFGLARAITAAGGDKLTQSGLSVGTPSYMSPEQASGRIDVDGRSDLYSLACVLYEMLAGEPPFTGPTLESVVRQHLMVEPPNIARLRPAVPADVVAALTRALAKTPADRFNPVAQFSEALGGRESRTGAALAAPPFWRHLDRRVRMAIVGTATLAMIAAAFALVRRSPVNAKRTVVAVLALQNLSADSANSYFAGGLHDEILTQLSKIASLTVISRTSVLGYAGKNTPLKQIASELGAGTIVEGSVQVRGERLRVSVQLIDAATDAHLWADTYDRTLDDAFAIQSDVAQKIVAAVGAALTSSEQRELTEVPTGNPEAYQLWLQGREYVRRPGELQSNNEIAQGIFERAIALDPGFALAHASLANVHGAMYWNRYDPTPARAELQLREAREAIRLAPDLPQAHVALGRAYYYARRDYVEALNEYSIAEKGLPGDAGLVASIGYVNRRLGQWPAVIAAFEKATQLNPRDANLFADLGGASYAFLRRYDEAIRAYARALSLAPDLHNDAIRIGNAYVLWKGQPDTLRAVLDRMPRDAELGEFDSRAAQEAKLLLWERKADRLLQEVSTARETVFVGQLFYIPTVLYTAWAHQLRGDRRAAQGAFGAALVLLDSVSRQLPDDWRVTASRGLALAGLGRRDEALRMADRMTQSDVYRDVLFMPAAEEERARILAQARAPDAALEAIERLLAAPGYLTVHKLRLDPRWDAVRDDPRFKTLLTKYAIR